MSLNVRDMKSKNMAPKGGATSGSASSGKAVAKIGSAHQRNPGFELDLDWVDRIVMNRSALERRAATIGARRTVKKQYQAAWLLKAITLIDLTTLNSDDTNGRVRRLCAKAKNPVRRDILQALGANDLPIRPGAVCVYHNFVATAVEALEGTNIPVAAVSTAFPHGLTPLDIRLREIKASVKAGAKEIDIVIERSQVLNQDWQGLYDQIKAFREACGDAHIKTILGTGELATQTNVAKASLVCMLAGADFIKTSTGKEKVNANLVTSLSMVRMIREFYQKTKIEIGYKPAGGISSAKSALTYMALMKEELGIKWLEPHLFRFGASSLLTDIERQLEHQVTGRYAADYRQPMV
ncbi:MAG: deoxyribose-phosphate aldolase [Devosiaceae bacterium]|nr:deoxyribose-phosphate aldolase [Devosiaceae bacterium]